MQAATADRPASPSPGLAGEPSPIALGSKRPRIKGPSQPARDHAPQLAYEHQLHTASQHLPSASSQQRAVAQQPAHPSTVQEPALRQRQAGAISTLQQPQELLQYGLAASVAPAAAVAEPATAATSLPHPAPLGAARLASASARSLASVPAMAETQLDAAALLRSFQVIEDR